METHSRIGFGRVALTVVHLAFLGAFGWAALSIVVSLVALGLSLVLLAGLGLVVLVGVVYLLFGLGWFEVQRVHGLYGGGAGPLRWQPRVGPGFKGWLMATVRQSVDGYMWRALLSFTLATVCGVIVLWLAQLAAWLLVVTIGGGQAVRRPMNFMGDFSMNWVTHPFWSGLAALVALALMMLLAWLHAVIARSLLASPTRRALTAEVRTKTAQREGAVRAAEVERTRIERDLHDGVQPRLVSIGMTLGLAQQKIDEDPAAAKALISEAHTSTKAAITELRQLARGIHTSVLDDRGLDAALSALAARSHIPVRLDVGAETATQAQVGASRDAEAAVYFSIAEALTNAAKHSRASECRVTVRLHDAGTPAATLWARVEDNGIGGAVVQPGGGLDGISNRVLAAGGTIRLDSPHGGPTALEVSVPCAS